MPRTTLVLDDQVFRELKAKAAAEGTTMQTIVNALLRQGLRAPVASGYELRLRGHRAELQRGVDLLDRDKLFDLMDGR